MPAIMGDIADNQRRRTGEDPGGPYWSIFQSVAKSRQGVAVASRSLLLDHFGFKASAPLQTPPGTLSIQLIAAWLLLVGAVDASFLIRTFSNRSRQTAGHP